jgi:hypothetical protein
MFKLATACLILASSAFSLSYGTVIDSSSTLEIRFSVSNAVPADDTLAFGITGGTVNVLSPYVAATATLYDGNTQLGSFVMPSSSLCNPVGPCSWGLVGSFESASSSALFGPTAVVPFGAISSGTIDGRIDLTVQQGAVDIGSALPYFLLMISNPDGSGSGTYEEVNLLSTELVNTSPEASAAPEPSSITLFGLASLGFCIALAKRTKSHSYYALDCPPNRRTAVVPR